MKLLKTSKEIGEVISDCINKYTNISFAVAWIKDNEIYHELLKNKEKIKKSTFGIDFAGTDINVLNDFIYSDNVKIYKGKYTFHPKIYVFYNITRYTAIIGSANLTNGGMFNNDECAVLLTKENGVLLKDILKILEEYFDKAKIITSDMYETYKIQYENIKKHTQEINNSLKNVEEKIGEAPLINLSWDEVCKGITDDEDDFKNKIKILSEIKEIIRKLRQEQINTVDTKSDDFRKIIGFKSGYEHFGGLKNYYRNHTNTKVILEHLLKVEIDMNEEINIEKIIEHVREYLQVIKERSIGIATATRFLAMKYPNLFLCVNNEANQEDNSYKGNKEAIKDIFGIEFANSEPDKTIEKYITLLKMIYNTEYFNHKLTKVEKQNENFVAISRYKVVLLDTYFQYWKNN